MQIVGIAAVALGSYVVHVARTQGGIGVVLAGGALLIVGGIIVILVTSAGLYGAVSLSKIMLGIVSLTNKTAMLKTGKSLERNLYCNFSLVILNFVTAVYLLCCGHYHSRDCGSCSWLCIPKKNCKSTP